MAGPEGTAEELTTSAHTSCAALRTAAVSPFAALSQMPSILPFALAEIVGAERMACLQAATAAFTAALLGAAGAVVAPLGVVTAGVEDVLVVAVLVVAVLVVGGVAAVVAALGLLAVELVLLVLLLPQPAASAPAAIVTASHVHRCRII